MNDKKIIPSTFFCSSVVKDILSRATAQIKTNELTKRMQPSYIVQNQNSLLNTNIHHHFSQPRHSPNKIDSEPCQINQDCLMNTGILPLDSPLWTSLQQQKIALAHTKNVKNGLKGFGSKNSIITSKSVSSKVTQRHEILKKFQELNRQKFDKDDAYIDSLRQWKAHEESLKAGQRGVQISKPECKLNKNEQVMFDFEGKYSKRTEVELKNIDNCSLSGDVLNSSIKYRDRSMPTKNQAQTVTHKTAVDSNSTSKAVAKRLRTMQYIQQQINPVSFTLADLKKQMLESIKIKAPGINLTVDGEKAKVDKEVIKQSTEQSRIIDKIKSLQLKKNLKSNHETQRKTTFLDQHPIDLSVGKKGSKQSYKRFRTEASSRIQKSETGKISIENDYLHKFVLEEEGTDPYKELPSNRSQKRRVKTQVDAQQNPYNKNFQPGTDQLRIRQRLMSQTRQGDKLPKILSQHRKVEGSILREVKKRLYLF